MGLAASQARLLMLTGRKDDVESNLMFLANQKLSMARKSASLSKDYSEALNSTKLMWNNGSSTDLDLTYGLLMKYNQDNEVGQYMVADNSGAAVLNDSYANMLLGTGVNNVNGGGHLAMTDTQFLVAMGIDSTKVSAYTTEYLGDRSANAAPAGLAIKYDDADVFDSLNQNAKIVDGSNGKEYDYRSGNMMDIESTHIVSTNDTLSNRTADVDAFVKTTCSDIADALKDVMPNLDSTLFAKAIDIATKATSKLYVASTEKNIHSNAEATGEGVVDRGTNQVIHYEATGDTALDVNTLIKTFLTEFNIACGDTSRGVGSMPAGENGDSKYALYDADRTTTDRGTGKTDYDPTVSSNKDTSDGFKEASFYLDMYYFVQANGAKRSSSIDDSSYMQNQFQNGSLHLCKYVGGDSEWDAVSTSSEESLICTKSDEDNITQAESKYNAQKDELDSKEAQIDLQITNLDAERSAVDTEVDSVKTILNKNIERSFKLFQNA